MKNKFIIGAVVVAVAAGAYFIFAPKEEASNGGELIAIEIESQMVVQSITATGTVEPVTVVDVGTQVSGILTSLYVDYNSVVKKDQVIAELDKSTLLLDLNTKKNSLASSKSQYEYELANYARIKTLFEKELIADSEYEKALYDYESAKNGYEIAKNSLALSETNLGYATIYSPIDGVVLSRSVEEGQTVASSFSTPTLFSIAADLRDMRVIADVDEADIGNVKEGQKATFMVDAFPELVFEGTVTQVRQEAIVESNVVTYEVVISAANPDLKLKPGLTANIEVFTLYADCETVVPAAALSYTPAMPAVAEEGAPQRPMPEGDVIWIKQDERVVPFPVEVGVSNGILTEVISRDVKPGMEVIIGVETTNFGQGAAAGSGAAKSPFVQQRPGQQRR